MSSGGHGGGGLPLLHSVEHWLHGAHEGGGVHLQGRPIIIAYVTALVAFLVLAFEQSMRNFLFVLFLSPLWLTYMLGRLAIARYIQARRAAFIAKQEHVLLEIRMPRDTMKSPLAMEAVLSSMHLSPGESTWWKKYVNGAVRPWWSLEIVSIGGEVRFYVWTRTGFRRLVEAAFYAQYPGVEVIEAMDYSKLVEPTDHHWGMFGTEYSTPPDKAQAYPIKTYVEYGLQAGQKPEEQVDPLAQLIETMGALGPGEQFWVQFIIRVSKKEKYRGEKDWVKEGKEEIERIRKEATTEYKDPVTGAAVKSASFQSAEQKALIESISRNIDKLGFDVGIRSIYTAPKDKFQGNMISFQIGLFKPFNSTTFNSIGAMGRLSARFNDWPWEDPGGHHKHHEEHLAVEMYRRRMYFHDPYEGPWSIMSTEELATLFHVPSGTVTTPSLPRIQSQTSGAPANLPT